MSAVDSLPGDQRAVLQLVLGRERSYEDIARLLSIDPARVRERALAALDALGPQTRIDQPSRAQICDYLLGQLPDGDVEAVRNRLAGSAGQRAWARVVSSELTPLASKPLPEIPPEASAGRVAPPSPWSSAMLERAASVEAAGAAEQPPPSESAGPAAGAEQADAVVEGEHERTSLRGRLRRPPKPPKSPKPPKESTPSGESKPPSESSSGPRSSRLGGMIVIGLVVAIIVVGVIVLLGSGGSKKKPNKLASTPTTAVSTTAASATTPASAATTPASSSTTTTSTTSTAAKVVAQINLTPPAAGSKAAGIAEVLREGTTNGIAIVAQNVPPNTTHPPNAYAVWLYNSPTDAKILGFVNPGVPKNGKLSTAGGLPTNASHYKELIVTAESSANPKAPGTVILQGALTGV
jgi:sigma-70-like protein